MSDLSRLLDDVYEPAVKDDEKGWTSDEALDNAFSGWVPGPSDDASETEKALFTAPSAVTGVEAGAFADTTSDAGAPSAVASVATAGPSSILSDPPSDRVESAAADVFNAGEWTSAPVTEAPAPDGPPPWSLQDDDILPRRSSANRFFAFRR
ncbi:MAG TPA: hypothetical protein VGH94_14040 [Acidimicrobiales bacterium]|jgi:hypothetical protein